MNTAPKRRKPKPADIESIISAVETPETSVTLCLKGSLVAEHERLSAQLDGMTVDPVNLAGDGPGLAIAAELGRLREQMLAHNQTFLLRAVTPRGAWRALSGKRPVKTKDMGDEQYEELYHAWVCEVVATSATEPPMNADQVQRLADVLSNGQWKKLAEAAWSVNDDAQGIPFSVAASALSRSSGEKSRQPEPSDSPAHASLAGSPEPSPSTNTTPTAG